MTNRIPWGPDSPDYDKGCPVPAGHDCTVYFRDGTCERNSDPWSWGIRWRHYGQNADIIAYCDHDAPDQARELLAEALEALNYLPYRNERSKRCAARIDAYLKGAA